MALQIAIVEDWQPDAQRLQALVRQELGAAECGIFPSGDAYLQQMPARKDDLVFLDICMEAPAASRPPSSCAGQTRKCSSCS